MRLTIFKSKIHRCRVTEADISYNGSISICYKLMDAAGIMEHEMVHVWNITSGTRLQTYALRSEDEGAICINGAAAHLVDVDDLVILCTFVEMEEEEVRNWKPKVVLVDSENKMVQGPGFSVVNNDPPQAVNA